ncbi:MAG: hypothetical protein ACE5KJ_06965, partial [Candidatus Zixiibacteriota bacterium]
MKGEFESLSRDLKEMDEALNKNKNEHENIKTQIGELRERESIFAEEEGAILQKLGKISSELEGLVSYYEEKKKIWESKIEEKKLLEENIEQNQNDLDQLSSEEAKTKFLLSAEEAKLGMLRQISEHYEGYGKGQKAVLSARNELTGIIDTVANLFTTRKEYLKAIESVLGESLQFLVCQDVSSALKAIRYLKENQKGGATFLPLDKIEKINWGQERIDLQDFEGTVGWASDLISYKEEFRKIADLLLGNAILVKTLNHCLELSQKIPAGFHLVSLDGDVISSKGSITGGSPKEISLLGRELEIQRIKDQIFKLKEKCGQLQREKKTKEYGNLKLKDQLSQISIEAERLTSDFQQREFKLKTSEFEKASLEKRSRELKELKQQITPKLSELSQKQKSLSQSIKDIEDQKERLRSQIDEKQKFLEEAENLHNHLFQRINQLKIELVSLQGKEEQKTFDNLRLTELISEMEVSLTTKGRETKESLAKIEEINKSILEKREKLKSTFEKIEEEKKSLNSLQEDQTERQKKLNDKEKDLKLFRGAKEKFQDEFHQLEMEKLELSSRAESIRDRIWEEYKVDLEKIKSKDQSLTEDLEGTEEKLNFLKEKVKSIGPVNLLALEE